MTSVLRWTLPFTFLAALAAACSSSGGSGGGGTDARGCPADFDTDLSSFPRGDCEVGQVCSHTFSAECTQKDCSCEDGTWSCKADDLDCTSTKPWVSGYYVGYQRDLYPPEAIAWSGLSHLMIGAVLPRADGTLDTSLYLDPTAGPALGEQLASLAHQNGKKAIVMLGGAGVHDAFASAASAANRAAFVSALVQLKADWNVDGFDLDWEPLEQADQADFKALAQDLRAALPGLVLTVPVGWVNANSPTVDPFYGEIAPLFDQINIMSYGMAGAWDGWQSWHSSALSGATATTPSSVESSLQAYVAAGVPASKLGIGIGFYGSCWSSPVSGPGQDLGGSDIVASDNVMTFDHIMSAYHTAGAYHFDGPAQAAYLGFAAPQGPEGCTFVSYEDEASIAAKAQYVRTNGYGGAIVWTINQGYRPSQPAGQRDPLMKALAAFLK
jgi:chitinase